MAKPTQLPRWATDVAAPVTPEPTEGKKDLGWAVSEKPPAQYFNWWMKLVYQWIVWVNDAASGIAASVLMVRDAAGRAKVADPAAADDIDTQGARDTAISTHNGVTNPHSATSAATASRLVLRDAAGRAQVADPSAAADIDTKGARDAAIGSAGSGNNGTGGTGWSVNTRGWVVGKMAHIAGTGSAAGGAAWTSILTGLTFPMSYVANGNTKLPGFIKHSGSYYPAIFAIDGVGTLSATMYLSGGVMAALPALAAGDEFHISLSYPTSYGG